MKKAISLLLPLTLLLSAVSCSQRSDSSDTSSSSEAETTEASTDAETTEAENTSEPETTTQVRIESEGPRYEAYASMTPEEIVACLTMDQKVNQMVQPAIYNVTAEDMKENDYGSILSTVGCIDAPSWRETVDDFQKSAIASEAGIPYIYGQDDVHGVNYCLNAVYFPHNIGQGAANDEELAYQVGLITADEAKLCHMMWNFSPCVAQSVDPRWGRTYESYGSDLETITRLSTAYTKGLIDGGLVACTKHFFADGNVVYGTGEPGGPIMLIDRGDAQLTDAEIDELLKVYQAQIDAGVQTIMISHSSLNGVKMHENKEYIMKLKDEMGFKGFIVSDWGSVGNISGGSYREQVIKSVNAGIDMLMETDRFEEAKEIIIDAVGTGEISEERVNDAVTRIIRVKKDEGLFDDPLLKNIKTEQDDTGSLEYRKVAEKLVEESLVLLKNENDVLPLKKGAKVYITGPAADNCQAQCGGWTMDWNGPNAKNVPGVTTIQEAFERYADDYGIDVITDKDEAENADVVLLCVGEAPYAEWNGDTKDMALCGALGLDGNSEAMSEAKALGKPIVTCIVAGRQVILSPRFYNEWDSVVMCYLPGSEGKGISDVLCGCADFTGKLPSPWYDSIDQIGTDECWFERGYGLSYSEGFKPEQEPETVLDPPKEPDPDPAVIGTDYKSGLYKDGVYVNDYAKIKLNVPDNLMYYTVDYDEKKEWIAEETDEQYAKLMEAQVYDAYFANSKEAVFSFFINTNILFPETEEISAEDLMDYCKKWVSGQIANDGNEADWKERETVKLGSEEFSRDVVYYDFNGTQAFDSFYMKKIDDDFICWIYVTTSEQGRTPEYYESLFG